MTEEQKALFDLAAQDALDHVARAKPDEAQRECMRLCEALIFAATEPLSEEEMARRLPEGADLAAALAFLEADYFSRGVNLARVGKKWFFRTAPDLAWVLQRERVEPRKLSRAALETLSIVAYHQPVTRPEIEQIRGAALSQATLDALLESGLVAPQGRKEVPGRPTLWGTTPAFLLRFGLRDLRDLPRREDLLVEPPTPEPREQSGRAEPPSG